MNLKKIVQELVFLTIFINIVTSLALKKIARKLIFLAVFVDVTTLLRMKRLDTHFPGYFHRCSYIIRLKQIVKKFIFLSVFIDEVRSLGLKRSLTNLIFRPFSSISLWLQLNIAQVNRLTFCYFFFFFCLAFVLYHSDYI